MSVSPLTRAHWNHSVRTTPHVTEVSDLTIAQNSEYNHAFIVKPGSNLGWTIQECGVVNVTNEGHLNGISIISIAESPGLGMEAEPVLVPQFVNGGEGRDDMPFSLIKNADPEAGQIASWKHETI